METLDSMKWINLYLDSKFIRFTKHDVYVNVYRGGDAILTYNTKTKDVIIEIREIEFYELYAIIQMLNGVQFYGMG